MSGNNEGFQFDESRSYEERQSVQWENVNSNQNSFLNIPSPHLPQSTIRSSFGNSSNASTFHRNVHPVNPNIQGQPFYHGQELQQNSHSLFRRVAHHISDLEENNKFKTNSFPNIKAESLPRHQVKENVQAQCFSPFPSYNPSVDLKLQEFIRFNTQHVSEHNQNSSENKRLGCEQNPNEYNIQGHTNILLSKMPKCDILNNDQSLQNFLQNIERRLKDSQVESVCNFKINIVQRKLLEYASSVKSLEVIVNSLVNFNKITNFETELIKLNSLVEVSMNLKEKIKNIQLYFNLENISKIKDILDKRREKRERWRRGRAKRKERKQKIKKAWKDKEIIIDQKLKKFQEEEKEKLNEQNMKREADAVLREVRTKQEEAQRIRKLLEALSKLRDSRKKKGDIHGYIDSPQGNKYFNNMKDEFEKLLTDQINLYQAEEEMLKVMMEESNLSHLHSKLSSNSTLNVDNMKKQAYEILFGKRTPPEEQNEFERSFVAAEESVEILVKRRSAWDQFLTNSNDILGSSIPIGWVCPNSEPNPDWKPYQQIE